MNKWISHETPPKEGQYVWVAYRPWDNPSNGLQVQPATYRNGEYHVDNGGTSYKPWLWMPNPNEPPPEPPKLLTPQEQFSANWRILSDQIKAFQDKWAKPDQPRPKFPFVEREGRAALGSLARSTRYEHTWWKRRLR